MSAVSGKLRAPLDATGERLAVGDVVRSTPDGSDTLLSGCVSRLLGGNIVEVTYFWTDPLTGWKGSRSAGFLWKLVFSRRV